MKKFKLNINEAGVDEAGRGPLIGRVYAGAVIWGNLDECELITDSKKLSKKKRKLAFDWIKENVDNWAVGYATEKEIDDLNILEATKLAMKRAIANLHVKPSNVVIDGVRWEKLSNEIKISVSSEVKGDSKFYSIAAASIIAKEYHDEHIREICEEDNTLNDKYDLLKNMGYGTKKHREGIENHGICKYHRCSFKPCSEYI
tara:strand:- start:275 stop:877 length:603 start_codon:yes stop_codon:yes gene_type:complete